jgi:hypothetical protein
MNKATQINEEKNHYIYLWKYPEDVKGGEVFYVGQGKHGNQTKYARAMAIHYQVSGKRKSYAQNVFDKIIQSRGSPDISIVFDNLTITEANTIEKALIAKYGRRNIGTGILCNLTEGGDVNPMNDPEVRIRQLNALRTDEYKLKKSIWASEVNSRPETIQKHKTNSTKMWENPEFRNKLVALRNTPEMIEKNRKTQSEISGVKVVFNGVEYPSKFELSRYLGISFQMLTYRLKNNIPLDAPKNYRRSTVPST